MQTKVSSEGVKQRVAAGFRGRFPGWLSGGLASGDINGFFGLMFDNVSVLSFLAGILIIVYDFPAEIIYTKMFPGTVLGVLVGNLGYTYLAYHLARQTGSKTVTAIPLGLDTPSTIGFALVVLGPAFVAYKKLGLAPEVAALKTWHLGMAMMLFISFIKAVLAFFGNFVQKVVPRAGLLGSLSSIGLVLIGFVPLVDILSFPLVGLVSLGIVLGSFAANLPLPGKFPGILAAVICGTLLYHLLGQLGFVGNFYSVPALHFKMALALPSLAFIEELSFAFKYLPIIFPFVLLSVVGGINVVESAKLAGDHYQTKEVILYDALAALISGLFGGVAQTIPYIGHSAYKSMGARSGYTLLTGIFMGLGGICGYLSFIIELIPRSVLAPILVFVALDIMSQAFHMCLSKHFMAVALAHFPAIARLLAIKFTDPEIVPLERFQHLLSGKLATGFPEILVTISLGNGFIITSMFLAAFLVELIDHHLVRASAYLLILAVFTFFGVVHSVTPIGNMYLPWQLPTLLERSLVYELALGYFFLAVLFLGWSFWHKRHTQLEML